MTLLLLLNRPDDGACVTRMLPKTPASATWVVITQPWEWETALARGGFEVVLTEARLPWTDGLCVLRTLQARYPQVPVVMLTDAEGEDVAIEGLQHGLSDYVRKDQWHRLPLALHTCLTTLRLQRELQQTQAALAERTQLTRVMAEVGMALTRHASLRDILHQCTAVLVHHVGAALARIWTLNQENQALELQASAGLYTHLDGPHRRVPVGAMKIGRIAQTRQPHLTNTVLGDAEIHDQAWAAREGLVAFAGHPLLVAGSVVGVMAMFARHPLAQPTLDTLAAIADQIALGIERKRAEELRAAEARFLRGQAGVAQVALSSLDPVVLMPRILAAVCAAQEYAFGFFWRVTDEARVVVTAGDGDGTAPFLGYSQELDTPESLITQALQTRQPAYRNRLQGSPFASHPLVRAMQVQAALVLPLISPTGSPMGALSFGDAQQPERFTELDLYQGVVLAHQVRQALENCLLFGQVQQLQSHHRVVMETLHDAVYTVDAGGHITFANAALEHLTGYRAGELLRQPTTSLYYAKPPPDKPPPETPGAHGATGLDPAASPYTQTQMLRKDGQRVDVEITTAPLFLGGQLNGHVTAARDITQRLRLEAQLRHAQKMQALGTVAGGIAHDFNNILGALLAFAEVTLDDVPEESVAWNNLQQIIMASERGRGLVQQLLTFSRQTSQERSPVACAQVVQAALPLVRATLPETITLRHDLDSDTGTILANPTQLHQVLLNLCNNAAHAMRERGGVLDLRLAAVTLPAAVRAAHPGLGAGPYACMTVRDTGCGISPEVLERIFEPFFTTKGVGEGTGLGLAVVHGIVTDHGGAITVESTPGHGTTFAVYLPRTDLTPATSGCPQEPLPGGHERILLVDDEAALAQVGSIVLTRLGYDVVPYTDSTEALAAFRAAPAQFDLLITDQVMPGLTGDALVHACRGLRPDLPVILLTGFSHTLTAEKARQLGADAFCMKPLSTRDLADVVRRVLAQHSTREG